MKKLGLSFLLVFGIVTINFAQSEKIMVSAGFGVLAPACTNCDLLSGFEAAGGYAITEKIVGSVNLGFFSWSEGSSKLNAFAIGVSGEYYFKEAFKGFYASPDVTFISTTAKSGGNETGSENNLTVGLNLGWAIAIGDNFRIIPHFGYGTWFEGTDGRITTGLKVGYKL